MDYTGATDGYFGHWDGVSSIEIDLTKGGTVLYLALPTESNTGRKYFIRGRWIGQDFVSKQLGVIAKRIKPRSSKIVALVNIPGYDRERAEIISKPVGMP